VYVIEQNRDAQLKTLLVTEHGFDPAKLVSILNYDGMPMTAEQISKAILEKSKSTIATIVVILVLMDIALRLEKE